MAYNLDRFIIKQQQIYEKVYKELKEGKKKTHWMWYIFPQIEGLGNSAITKYYAIKDKKEAIEYFNNEYLKRNYLSLCEVLLNVEVCNPVIVFGSIDSLKLQSSLTLFYTITNNDIIYKVLQKFYNGKLDDFTYKIINNQKETSK